MGQKAIYNVLQTKPYLYPFKKQWSRSPPCTLARCFAKPSVKLTELQFQI